MAIRDLMVKVFREKGQAVEMEWIVEVKN